ncbi:Alpha/Beta hydrolase protein [Chiua virens]|nr:Alpha/Beta hydrolase protein [Chiua virens]
MVSIIAVVLLGVAAVQASSALVSKQSITALTASQIDSLTQYAYFASAAYCNPSTILSWTCGVDCANNSDFEPVASGGDGVDVQYWYVGYKRSLNAVIVAHQGTTPSKILPLLTDADAILGGLDPSLFPGLPSDIAVHQGFRDDQSMTASDILSSVQTALSKYGTSSVTLVGHSLGAALSILDSVYLPLHLPSGTTFQAILFGLPRVGNQAFADYVDGNLNLTHVNNLKDPIPIMPGMFMGFVHPAGEVHITDSSEWVACPGQDNPSTQCIVGDVPNIFEGDEKNHDGPYNGSISLSKDVSYASQKQIVSD